MGYLKLSFTVTNVLVHTDVDEETLCIARTRDIPFGPGSGRTPGGSLPRLGYHKLENTRARIKDMIAMRVKEIILRMFRLTLAAKSWNSITPCNFIPPPRLTKTRVSHMLPSSLLVLTDQPD